MTITAGTQCGPFQILEKIGSGGMGEVYHARDTRLNRDVAVKFVSEKFLGAAFGSSATPQSGPETPASPGTLSRRRFLREAQASSALNHPNICTIYDIGEHEGQPYLVMELLRGETLKDLLRQGPLAVPEVLDFSRQAASALAAAHALGIIHRDIKPANLFIVGMPPRRQIKILDFGLAKRQGAGDVQDSAEATSAFAGEATAPGNLMDLTSPGSTIGTAAYMSPEQARSQTLDARSDLFSLGSVIYEMASGRKAFEGNSAADVFAALLTEDPPPVSATNPTVPAGFDVIVAKLLARDKDQRYQTADEALADLEKLTLAPAAAVNGNVATETGTRAVAELRTPSSPAPKSAQEPEPKRSQRNPAAVAALAVVLLALGWLGWRAHTSGQPAATAPGAATGAPEAVGPAPALVKDSIILASFINHTGDPVFDTTLNEALRIDLEQSPVINIVSQDHLRQSVKFLGKPEDTPVTPEIAREIGEREGMKAILTGTIAKVGDEYVVMLSAQNTATGDEIASEQATAPDKDHVLDALNKTAAGMRARLGEDLASIKKLNTPFGQATTTSLEAFRAYALGDVAHDKAQDIPEAEGHYLRAVELDPDFAMAYARLGVIYNNSGQVAKAKQYFAKAWQLSNHVSESERLYIAGHYYGFVTGDVPRQIEALQESIQTYPGQVASYININVAYQSLGQFGQALPFAQKAVELQPDDAIAAENLLSDQIALGHMQDAQQEIGRQHRLGMDSSTDIENVILVGDFLTGQTQDIQKIVNQVAGRPDEFLVSMALAATHDYSGQFRQGSATYQQGFEQAGRVQAPDVQASILLQDATSRGLAGMCDNIDATIARALALDKSKQTRESAALAGAICGSRLALPLAQQIAKENPEDTLIHDVYLPLTRSFLDLAAGQARKAIDDAAPARSYDAIFPASYAQGLAALALHDSAGAILDFRAASHSQAADLITGTGSPFYVEAELGLARAYAMAGDKANAKQAYQTFFAVWKNADPDIPMFIAAKKEAAAL
ncbi:MAG TPA: serine/threonine-protein kinase [Acidobacteriaceae bacterium]|jgi:eukaryotic-like serine/threonine-protein kinase|nr:serine/threonine-protein kinase [Acidobacteriaceae bacterium]